ncbi:MAG: molybdopterin-dependent oxidoreductase, partial [Chloroflexota bacterium]|nr:molybdopterin-dependent oxidoreductase [Chloroflexota bacterium]
MTVVIVARNRTPEVDVTMTALVGKRVKRREDPRLLRGDCTFVADITLPGMVHCAVLRSPHAHALITHLDVSAARVHPGVVDILTAQDVAELGRLPVPVPSPFLDPEMPYPLALDEVAHVGQAVAIVAADSRYIAEDALELIEIEYEEVDAIVGAQTALEADAPRVHRRRSTNLAGHVRQSVGDVDRAFAVADRVVEVQLSMGRVSGQPLETRGVVANYEPSRDRERLMVWASTQVPHTVQRTL